jgi:hypothetical protein
MQGTRSHKIVKATTAALAAALFAVPVAQARLAVDARHSALLNKDVPQQAVVRTDARHAALLNKAHGNPLIAQEPSVSKIGHLGALDRPTSKTPVGTASTGFDWSDAGVGAGAVFGLVLLASGGALVTRRRLVRA